MDCFTFVDIPVHVTVFILFQSNKPIMSLNNISHFLLALLLEQT